MKNKRLKENSLFSIVNISVKKPISENRLAAIIRSGLFKAKYCAHIFSFFTDVPLNIILAFIRKHRLSPAKVARYYEKNVKKFYRNAAFEDYLKYAAR